jgi:hypothetical protein
LRNYDFAMHTKFARLLPIAIFLAVAVVFDSFSVAAIFEAGFDGVQRTLLTVICLVVGTVSAFVLTRPLVRRLVR